MITFGVGHLEKIFQKDLGPDHLQLTWHNRDTKSVMALNKKLQKDLNKNSPHLGYRLHSK